MRAWTVPLLLAAATLLALAACGGGGRPNASTPTPFAAKGTPVPGGCTFIGLNQPKRMLWPSIYLGKPAGALVRFHEDEPVPISFQVVNCGTEPVRVTYASSQRYDIVVEDDDDNEVWRWSRDKLFTQAISEEEFESFTSVTYFELWDKRDNEGNLLPAGRYEVTASLVGQVGEGVGIWRCGAGKAACQPYASQNIALSP